MTCYLNRGLILEQAVAELLREYLADLKLESKYENFRVKVTNRHPFADLLVDGGIRAADTFPAVVVGTETDRKPPELDALAPHVEAIGLEEADIEQITADMKKPGLCTVVDDDTLGAIRETIGRQGVAYGWSMRVRRQDTLGVDIWCENEQLKNELYEQVRLFVLGAMRFRLDDEYSFFDIALFDGNVRGERSGNYNMDFDVVLTGAHLSFEVNYCEEQIAINTELSAPSDGEIILEVKNDVKKN